MISLPQKSPVQAQQTPAWRRRYYLEDLLGDQEVFVVNKLLQVYELLLVLFPLLWIADQHLQLFNQL